MKIVVCIKQVPDTTEVKIDPVTNTLIRQGVPSIVNPYDKNALEAALRLRDTCGGQVTVLTMGPPQAKEALKECLAIGADEAILISDRAFGGADTLATSYTLAQAIRRLGACNLIFCGKQAIDGDTAQVGPEIAEHLGLPQVAFVSKLDVNGSVARLIRENDDGYEVLEAALPLVVTVVKSKEYEPRLRNVANTLRSLKKEIPVWGARDLDTDSNLIGLTGSPTKVSKIYTPSRSSKGVVIRRDTARETVGELMSQLADARII